MKVDYLEKAKGILLNNRKDGFTIPNPTLYPFQWNWDSGFIALGYSHFDLNKAIEEIDTLFESQWGNGFVPHIIFHDQSQENYFPNYEFWHSASNPTAPEKPTSGITQPAVHGFIIERLLEQHPNSETLKDFIIKMIPKLMAYHRFLYSHRDPNNEGLFYIYHPWASGRDNSPIWDESLNRIKLNKGEIPDYQRVDITIADASERPTSHQYDRYVYLLDYGKKNQFDGKGIDDCPLRIQDCMMNAILIKSNDSIIKLGKQFGIDVSEVEEWQKLSKSNFHNKFWNEENSVYASYDMVAQKQIGISEIGGYVALFAQIPDTESATKLADKIKSYSTKGYYLFPSYDPETEAYDAIRYWRGPIWPHMNWMIYHGLVSYGYPELAEQMKQDTLTIIEKFGFYEYFDARKLEAEKSKKGYGGNYFSWTASTYIDFKNM